MDGVREQNMTLKSQIQDLMQKRDTGIDSSIKQELKEMEMRIIEVVKVSLSHKTHGQLPNIPEESDRLDNSS